MLLSLYFEALQAESHQALVSRSYFFPHRDQLWKASPCLLLEERLFLSWDSCNQCAPAILTNSYCQNVCRGYESVRRRQMHQKELHSSGLCRNQSSWGCGIDEKLNFDNVLCVTIFALWELHKNCLQESNLQEDFALGIPVFSSTGAACISTD